MAKKLNTGAVTPIFRVSWPFVFTPRKNELNTKEEIFEYSLMSLFGPEIVLKNGLAKLIECHNNALINKFGDESKWPKNLRSPFRAMDEKAENGIYPPGMSKGGVYMNLKSRQKPGVVDQNVQPILDETEFYSGCYAIAKVSAYAYDFAGNRGVSFSVINIQKVKDGDPLGGRTRPEDDFKAIEGAGDGATSETLW